MKRLFIGLLLAGSSFGISAFTTFNKHKKAPNIYYYVMRADGYYYPARNIFYASEDYCTGIGNNKCFIGISTFTTFPFLPQDTPGTILQQSRSNGRYIYDDE